MAMKKPPSKPKSKGLNADQQYHQDQRSAFRNHFRANGQNKINRESVMDVMSTYGVQANGQTLEKFQKQLDEKDKAIRADAQRARLESRSSGTSRGNPAAKPIPHTGNGPKATKPAQSKGGAVDRSEAVKRAWATRRQSYGDSGRKK